MSTSFSTSKTLAKINEEECVGCTLCIAVCPVDAIIGAAKQMHVVMAQYCIGCKLCIPPCPVDCITMEKNPALLETAPNKQQRIEFASLSRLRAKRRKERLLKQKLSEQEMFNKNLRDLYKNNSLK